MSNEKNLHPHIKVCIYGSQRFFGPGVAALLRSIKMCGSVIAACDKMQISYSKGRYMIRRMEKELGYTVVQRMKGGHGGGSAQITPEGERLLKQYELFEQKVLSYAQNEFENMMCDVLSP